ncbi:MAG: HTTM domain-containing protein [Planctomycetaceae bacterium]
MTTATQSTQHVGRPAAASASRVTAPAAGRSWLAEWAAAWNAFWFTPADPLPLAVIRILTGLILTWSCVVWLLDADAFFGDRGWLRPDQVWRQNDQPWQWSLYFAASSPTLIRVVAGISLVAALLVTVGLATPLAALVSLVGLVSAANRAPLNVFGLDDTLGMLLVPLVVGPAGARLSVDRLLAGPGQGRGGDPSVRAAVALRMLQVHLCVVYLFSGTGKLFGASWWEGTALWGAIANDRYRTLDLRPLAAHPLVVNGLTLATLWWEVGYAALVWPRLTRRLWLAMAVLVHLGIGLAMGMMEFGLAMITANLAFVPAAVFARLLRRFAAPDSPSFTPSR